MMGDNGSKPLSIPSEKEEQQVFELKPPTTIIPRTFTKVLNTDADATTDSAPTLSVMTWNVMAEVWR